MPSATARSYPVSGELYPSQLVRVVASRSVRTADTVPAGSRPLAWRRAKSGCRSEPAWPTGPSAAEPRTVPRADRNTTRSRALLVPVPPSRAARRNLAPAGLGRPVAVCTGTRWASTAVPPAPPANSFPDPPPARRPGKPLVPYRTTVGRPRSICQPGIVTASQPCADASPVSAPPLATRLVPGRTVAAGRAAAAGAAVTAAGPVTARAAIVIPVASPRRAKGRGQKAAWREPASTAFRP